MIRDETLRVEKTDLDFSFFKNEKPLILDRDISVLILPSFTQKDAFHNGTIEIFSYLQEKISPEEVELFSTDEDYKELALHSRAHWLGVFLITSLAAPIFTSVISDYISNELQAKNGDEVDFSIIIEKKREKNIIVSYRGDAEKVNEVLNTVKELSEDEKKMNLNDVLNQLLLSKDLIDLELYDKALDQINDHLLLNQKENREEVSNFLWKLKTIFQIKKGYIHTAVP